MAGSIGSPRSHHATMSILGSSFARSLMVFPIRPAAPMSNTRTADDFILEEHDPLPREGKGDCPLAFVMILSSSLTEGAPIEVRSSRSKIISAAQTLRASCAGALDLL